jgi:hypothetical protein
MTRRSAFVVAVFAASLAACGGGNGDGATATVPGTGETTTIAPGGDDRPLAPDFTLTLQPEGEFVLSEAGKPVYLVFWAEW